MPAATSVGSPQFAQAEAKAVPGSTSVSEAVARNLFKLMAVKDEYEVARLYTDGSFKRQLDAQFQSYERLEFHLAPPMLGRKGPDGKARKSTFGPWMMKAFRGACLASGACAARRSTCSAIPRSGAWNAACLPSMRATST